MTADEKLAIARTEAQSATLTRGLRLRDLVFLQVLLIMGPQWIGWAATQGGTHVALWLLAIVLFYAPIAATVIFLSRRLPLEGGAYQWVKLGISRRAGFMAAWNLSVFLILFNCTNSSAFASGIAYMLGPGANWITTDRRALSLIGVLYFGLVYLVNVRGLHMARWATGAGGLITVGLYALMAAVLAPKLTGGHPVQTPAAMAMPALSIMTVSVFCKICINAFSGFEQVAVFAGECQAPARNIGRSVWIAGPAIALLYILGTCAVLAWVPIRQIDLLAPIPQVLTAAMGGSAFSAGLSAAAIAGLQFATFTLTVACVAQTSRMPMVAGWDGLLPERFSRLHPRFRTPVASLRAITLASVAFGSIGLIGAGQQEAAQILIGAGFACCGLYYVAIFAVVFMGRRDGENRAPWQLRMAAGCAALVTVLSVGFQVVPVMDVPSPWSFAAKVVAGMVVLNAAGLAIYQRAAARQPY